MNSRLRLITERATLTTTDLAAIALEIDCHRLSFPGEITLRAAVRVGDEQALIMSLVRSYKILTALAPRELSAVEWDFTLALRTWLAHQIRYGKYDPISGKIEATPLTVVAA